ncbi:hypothetical protein Glove_122g147 [Diversispora epigaea]|uniref:Uncharacterized protein n=1 Tax=Diversispora epigaea TaxID=1348612 RepID=A0A397J930_9GLOM|nr:hypothetical protein Glove_122g147 [Diversispora epigaea]
MQEDCWITQSELKLIVERVVNSVSNVFMNGSERQLRIFQILPQFNNAFEEINNLYDMGTIKTDKETPLGSDQIENNTNKLKNKLRKESTPLYQHLYFGVNKISVQELTWKDPLANQIIRDNSNLVQGLPGNLKKAFMKPVSISRVEDMCNRFVSNFLSENLSSLPYELSHTNEWKESEDKLKEISLKILETLESVWHNLAFCSEFVATMNEGTYVNNIIVSLINACLSNNHFGEFERQSIASADRRGDGRVGRRPDIMFISKEDDKYYELMYAECSRIICTKQKEEDDDIKLWQQFGIIGIQVARCRLSLNVLIRDELEVHRYYKLHETEIPIRYSNDPSILADFIYTLLLFRNTLIVNMSLLRCAHDRRSNRNLDSSTGLRIFLHVENIFVTQHSSPQQFGIIGIQVARCRLSLNVLIRDELEVHRYYKLHETEIPIRYSNDPSILADFIYTLLLFRNTLIVNMSLLRCAHDRRSNRNLDSSTVTSPPPNS